MAITGTPAVHARIDGYVDPAFEPLRDAFEVNFRDRHEVGASVCVNHRGRMVVDLWGGMAAPATQTPWDRDTISIVFSCTKGAAALCAHMLAEQGALSLHEDVARIWPDFAVGGKAGTTLANMLAHTSSVPHLREPLKRDAFADWDYMVGRVAAEPAWWAPGTRQGYHAITYAWTVGQMVRLAASEPLGVFFKREVADRLGLDFHIGLPEADEHRVASLIAPNPAEMNPRSRFAQAVAEAGSLPQLFLTNNGGADFNTRQMHAAEVASANGIANARALAGLYAPMANGGGGLLRAETIALMGRVTAATHVDATLLQPMRFGLGFMTSIDNRMCGGDSLILGEAAFGHVGMGGSVGFADPDAELSFGYTMNRMGAGILLNERGQSLVDAAYRAIGYRSCDSGAWRK